MSSCWVSLYLGYPGKRGCPGMVPWPPKSQVLVVPGYLGIPWNPGMVPPLLPPQIPGLSCTGMSRDSLGHPGMVPPLLPLQIPGRSCTGISGDSLGRPGMVPPTTATQNLGTTKTWDHSSGGSWDNSGMSSVVPRYILGQLGPGTTCRGGGSWNIPGVSSVVLQTVDIPSTTLTLNGYPGH